MVLKWYKSKLIDKNKNFLTSYNGVNYELPKVNKENIQWKPIVSKFGSQRYNLSKFLSNKNRIFGQNSYFVRDSWQFQNFIKKQYIPANHKIVSFNVTSLFTHIPLDLALKCSGRRWSEISKYTSLSTTEFVNRVKKFEGLN